MLRLILLAVLAVGCRAQGMLGFPADCDRASCTAYVQWTVVSRDAVQFELEGNAMGWVAVGVSADQVMGVDGIDDVFACQRNDTTDDVYAQDTYNQESQPTPGRSNTLDSNQDGFQLISSSFTGGRIYCTFTRTILAANENEDRNLAQSAYLLLAVGPQRGGPDVTLGEHRERWASTAQIVLAPPMGMFGLPEDCNRAMCTAHVQWTVVAADTVQFELEGDADGWVAVGVSADQVMGVDGIDDVFACQRDLNSDNVYAQDTYNQESQPTPGRSNTRDSNQVGFQLISSSFASGRIFCTFTRRIIADNLDEDRYLDESAYLLLAVGAERAAGAPDVTLAMHSQRLASSFQVVLAPPPMGMFGFPEDCDRTRDMCMAYVQWTLVGSDTLQFDLEGDAVGWVAVGVSADQVMGVDGIDDVFACQRDLTTEEVYAQDTYNQESQPTPGRSNTLDSNQDGFQLISSSFASGRITCTFTRSILADDLNEDRNLNESAFLLLAFGDTRAPAGPNVELSEHNSLSRQASMAQVFLTPPNTGIFRVPSGCSRTSCTIYAQWTAVTPDTIEFELEGATEGWLAIGVSADQRMGGMGIDDVFACQRDAMSDEIVYAEDTYNPDSPRANIRDTDQTGFQLISSSYASGRISCNFNRSTLGESLSEDRNLNEGAFLLLALGDARGGPNVTIPGHNSVSRWASAAQTVLSEGNVVVLEAAAAPPIEQGVFRVPPGCSRDSCTVYVRWTLVGNDSIQFELEGMTMGWVAVGVSADRLMGVSGIDDVFVCQRDAVNDTVYAEDTYNVQVGRANMRDINQTGFQLINSSFSDGQISCSFTRSILAENLAEDRNLNESAFLLVALGGERDGPNVAIAQHNSSSRWASATQTVLSDVVIENPNVGMFGIPDGCSRATCTIYAQWMLIDSDTFQFELEGNAPGWVAFGASADAFMGRDGIDDVFVCQRATGDDSVVAEDTFNPQSQTTRANTRDSDQSGFQQISTDFTNGRIFCTFTRSLSTGDLTEDRDLSVPVFVLLAAGNQRGGPDVAIDFHQVDRAASAAAIDLTSGQNVAVGCPADPLIRVHGILMYLAWVWLVPTAYFFAANMRPAMPTGTWFQIHRALMVIAIAPSVLGFILIFVAFRNSNNPNGLITLGSQNPTGTTHFVFGIIILLLQFINPIISFLRCKPGGKNRWIFNWIHGYIIGYGVILLALINVSIGIWQYSTFAYGQADNSRYYPFWIWLAFIIVYVAWDSFLFVYSRWIGPILDKMWKKKGNEFEMKPTNATSNEKEDPPKKEPSKDAPLRYGFMIVNIFLLVVPGLVIMLLIAIGCI